MQQPFNFHLQETNICQKNYLIQKIKIIQKFYYYYFYQLINKRFNSIYTKISYIQKKIQFIKKKKIQYNIQSQYPIYNIQSQLKGYYTSKNIVSIRQNLRILRMQNQYKAPKTVKMFYNLTNKYYAQKNTNKLSQMFKELYFENQYQNLNIQSWATNIKISADYSNFNDAITPHFVKILELIKTYQLSKKSKQWQNAFDTHMKVVIQCLQLIKQIKQFYEFMWILKPIRTLIRATKKIFLQSMKHITTSSKLKNDLINTLNRFKSTRSLLEQVRWQIFPLLDNMQVSILFSFHNYEMIKMIIYTSKISLNPQNKFRDNYIFLKAKYALVNENFKEAEQHFQMINIKTTSQKRLVLKYLIPCKIFLGKMFKSSTNHKDQYFPQYQTLIKALQNASFKDFDEVIQKYQKVWIKRGIYLLMDRLRILIWRNLIKRVFYVMGQKIMFQKIQKAVKIAGGDQNINECICIIGNLIYEGYVKGFIYQNQNVKGLVLKKGKDGKTPFPRLGQIAH